jgi:hypothetical protein
MAKLGNLSQTIVRNVRTEIRPDEASLQFYVGYHPNATLVANPTVSDHEWLFTGYAGITIDEVRDPYLKKLAITRRLNYLQKEINDAAESIDWCLRKLENTAEPVSNEKRVLLLKDIAQIEADKKVLEGLVERAHRLLTPDIADLQDDGKDHTERHDRTVRLEVDRFFSNVHERGQEERCESGPYTVYYDEIGDFGLRREIRDQKILEKYNESSKQFEILKKDPSYADISSEMVPYIRGKRSKAVSMLMQPRLLAKNPVHANHASAQQGRGKGQ